VISGRAFLVLVNSAGTAIPKKFEDTTLEEMNRLIDINIRGTFVATQAALKHMNTGGRIIMMGSCVGERMMTPGLVPYSATKEPSRCLPKVCRERWVTAASRSTTSSRVRSTRT
jgi:short-subunit dehydrogenase